MSQTFRLLAEEFSSGTAFSEEVFAPFLILKKVFLLVFMYDLHIRKSLVHSTYLDTVFFVWCFLFNTCNAEGGVDVWLGVLLDMSSPLHVLEKK